MIYAIDPENTRARLTISAKYIDYEDYLFGNLDLTNFDYINKRNEKYLFLKNGFIENDKPKSILVLVKESSEKIIQFYASFYTHYDSIYIDPGSPGMKYVPKNETISLYFSNLLLNFIDFRQIEGKGEIYYEGGIHHFLNISDAVLGYNLNLQGIDMIEVFVKEINEDNNSTGFIFHYEQYLNYESSHSEGEGGDEGEDNQGKNDKTLLIIVVAAASVACLVIIIIILYAFWYKKKKHISEDINKISFEKERESNLLLDEDN